MSFIFFYSPVPNGSILAASLLHQKLEIPTVKPPPKPKTPATTTTTTTTTTPATTLNVPGPVALDDGEEDNIYDESDRERAFGLAIARGDLKGLKVILEGGRDNDNPAAAEEFVLAEINTAKIADALGGGYISNKSISPLKIFGSAVVLAALLSLPPLVRGEIKGLSELLLLLLLLL